MINFNFDDRTMEGTIILDGKLIKENLSEIKKSLTEAITKTDSLVVDHSNAEEFDFTYVLLLISLFRFSEQLKKKLFMAKGCPENFRNLLVKLCLADISIFSKTFLS